MTDEESFQSALDADPADHGMRLVFADWLAERGNPRADGYMWLGLNRKWPDLMLGMFFSWWPRHIFDTLNFIHDNSRLLLTTKELRVFDLWKSFSSRRAAEDAFALAYPKLLKEYPAEFRLNLETVR